jgi:hypothetical protein
MIKQIVSALLLLGVFSHPVLANDKPYEVFGKYKVYFSVFNSSFISPDIAQAYNLVRGKDRALINIAVVEMKAEGDTHGLRAVVNGHSANLLQQQKTLDFSEISEQNAVYYLASTRFTNEEILNFEIAVTPDPNKAPLVLKFSKKLYVDK